MRKLTELLRRRSSLELLSAIVMPKSWKRPLCWPSSMLRLSWHCDVGKKHQYAEHKEKIVIDIGVGTAPTLCMPPAHHAV